MNRLSREKSPYLAMHSENPVDWYPWCAEAFAQARALDRPIFLSIGYSACHWCHVIAQESFEDETVAQALNQSFISIKVDREERPDVDAVYMDAVQIVSGSGGWPMSILTTPEGKPFFAGMYFPREALLQLLHRAAARWKADRAGVEEAADMLARRMRALASPSVIPRAPSRGLADAAFRAFAVDYDERWGGFSPAPKFPSAHVLLFLLSYHAHTGDPAARSMAEGTLRAMARGGLFDQIGGGFCRYSVDRMWLVPHFEKMLYDNALLLAAYASAYAATNDPLYADIARRTADYVLREMTCPDGGFYSAQDADSEGREGAYYVFTREELIRLLGDTDGAFFCDAYGIHPGGNWEGKSIPNCIAHRDFPPTGERLERLRRTVYDYRLRRLPLGRDDKILTAWNALMIFGLCTAAPALNEPRYLHAARRAQAFVESRLVCGDGRILLRWRDGEVKGDGVLSDYAFYALALLSLYEAGQEPADLHKAETIAQEMIRRFGDGIHGGFYLYAQCGERLITRPRETADLAMPSGNSCAALVLARLARYTDHAFWQEAAARQLRFMAGAAQVHPAACCFFMPALLE